MPSDVIAPPAVMLRAVVARDRVVRDRQREPDADRRRRAAGDDGTCRRGRTRFCVAVPVNAPVRLIVPPVPTRTVVVTFERVTATAGAMSTLPPDAPIFASVVAASAAVAPG